MPDHCLVHGCKNSSSKGSGATVLTGIVKQSWICMPCLDMLRTGEVGYGTTFIHDIFDEHEDVNVIDPEKAADAFTGRK